MFVFFLTKCHFFKNRYIIHFYKWTYIVLELNCQMQHIFNAKEM